VRRLVKRSWAKGNPVDINIRIAGEAGQGVQTTGDLLVNAFADTGLHVFSTQSYMSRIRGGLNWYDVRVADRELWSGTGTVNVLVALSRESLDTLKDTLAPGGFALFDGAQADGAFAIDFTKIARDLTGSSLMANTVATGAVYAALDYDINTLCAYLAVEFKRKGQDTIDKNVRCARRGAETAAEKSIPRIKSPQGVGAPHVAYSGTDAIGLGALTSGVKFVAAYPMTPSTGVFTFIADKGAQYGTIVEQAEDEIAAINMICGATYAGVPSMVTTAGGGFALMVEGLALAGMLELPAFIMLGQRPAPATGLPTRTAQEDLKFAVFAGHGEFARAVYAPGTVEEAYALTRKALETAHKWQTPAILLTDQFLNDLRKNVPDLDETLRPIDRMILENPPENYERYAVTETGVSPRALPGSNVLVVVDSDEHWTDGHITEYQPMRVAMVDKRLRKAAGMAAEALGPTWYGPEEAEHVLVCWGSTYGPCREAVDMLNSQHDAVAMMHFSQVWPINATAAREALSVAPRRSVTVIEGNATGQFAAILRQVGVIGDVALVTKYDGMPFTGEEIAGRVAK
jgi:2-oxoglutarate/2-oxoacid ferredoxin oxidoreductase subunit alpha